MEEKDQDLMEGHPETRVALILQEGLKRKNMTLEKLSSLSGVAFKHLENMMGSNTEKWPAAPYMRSYLIKIGEILGFDGQKLWEAIREEDLTTASGSADRLPRNRYTFLQLNRVYVAIGAVLLLIALIFLIRLPSILGKPTINLIFPEEELTIVNTSPVTIRGILQNGTQLTVDEQIIPLEEDGSWSTEVVLGKVGINRIEIVGSKFLGRETKLIRQIIYEPLSTETSTPPIIESEPEEEPIPTSTLE